MRLFILILFLAVLAVVLSTKKGPTTHDAGQPNDHTRPD